VTDGTRWFAAGERMAGRYRLVGELGKGGMGVVWKAEDERMGRPVAVKTFRHAGDRQADEARRRFEREVRISAALRHPRIMVVHDAGEERGFPFLVMELIDGRSLGETLTEEGPPSVPDAVLLLRRLAQAIEHAHSQGVLHRDIKPVNVMVDQQGFPKLCDFGIACHRERRPEDWETAKNLVVGTPGYLAPEAWRGDGRDYPVDFYAFGCVAFELLTGRRRSAFGTAPPAPSSLRPGIPSPLDGLVLRLLAEDPAARPADAGQIVALLTELHTSEAARRAHKGPAPREIAAWRAEAAELEAAGSHLPAADLYRQVADGEEAAGGEAAGLDSRLRAARCRVRAGGYRAAEYEFAQVAQVGERVNGKEHHLTLEALSGVAYCMGARGAHGEALAVLLAVSELRGALGPDGPQAVAARYDVARCRAHLGDHEAAYRGFMEVAGKRGGTDERLECRCWAAWCLDQLGRHREAREEYHRLLPLCRQAQGTVAPWVPWLATESARRPEPSRRLLRRRRVRARRPPGA
jgi:eukaryotic-like serine/threonine-protein kinase